MIVRVAARPRFTVVDNTPIEDPRLSFGAVGVLVFLLSKPDDWRANTRHLATVRREGETAIRRLMGELEDAGYIERRRIHDPDTGQIAWECVVHEVPVGSGRPMRGFSTHGSPTHGSPTCGEPPRSKYGGSEDGGTRTEEQPPSPPADVTSLPLAVPAAPASAPGDPVTVVFDAWREATGHAKAKLDDKRRRRIKRAIDTHGIEMTVAAVRGVVWSPYHMGQNDSGTKYDDIVTVLRDGPQVEKFAGYELDPSTRPRSRDRATVADRNRERLLAGASALGESGPAGFGERLAAIGSGGQP